MDKETSFLLGLAYFLGVGSLVAGVILALLGDVATGLIFVAFGLPELGLISFLRTSPRASGG